MKESARRVIETEASKVLKEAGINRPPVKAEAVLDHLNLHYDYYDLDDPTLWDNWMHWAAIKVTQAKKAFASLGLKGALFQRERQVLIDKNLGDKQKNWVSLHEGAHAFIPWHKSFFIGDTAQTLSPWFQEELELEANYGAAQLLFMGKRFQNETILCKPSWTMIEHLSETFEASYESTLLKFVENSGECPMMMVASKSGALMNTPQGRRKWQYYKKSAAFNVRFPNTLPGHVLNQINPKELRDGTGLIGEFEVMLRDSNQDRFVFEASVFSNTYKLLTLVLPKVSLGHSIVVPSNFSK